MLSELCSPIRFDYRALGSSQSWKELPNIWLTVAKTHLSVELWILESACYWKTQFLRLFTSNKLFVVCYCNCNCWILRALCVPCLLPLHEWSSRPFLGQGNETTRLGCDSLSGKSTEGVIFLGQAGISVRLIRKPRFLLCFLNTEILSKYNWRLHGKSFICWANEKMKWDLVILGAVVPPQDKIRTDEIR